MGDACGVKAHFLALQSLAVANRPRNPIGERVREEREESKRKKKFLRCNREKNLQRKRGNSMIRGAAHAEIEKKSFSILFHVCLRVL